MAFSGYKFTADEILRLGNPKTGGGKTIADVMLYEHGYELSDDENEKLADEMSVP